MKHTSGGSLVACFKCPFATQTKLPSQSPIFITTAAAPDPRLSSAVARQPPTAARHLAWTPPTHDLAKMTKNLSS